MLIFSISSGKGGSGKTTTAAHVGMALSTQGKKVLSVDLDSNNNLTDFFLRDHSVEEIDNNNIYHAITNKQQLPKCIYPTKHFVDIIPSTPSLSRIEIELFRDPGVFLRFPTMLRQLDYDYVIIDTPPFISIALSIALYSSDVVICPVSWNRWTIQGYSLLREECLRTSQSTGIAIQLLAIPSMVTDIELMKLQQVGIWNLTQSHISKNISIKNSSATGNSLKPGSKSWIQFENLAKELLK